MSNYDNLKAVEDYLNLHQNKFNRYEISIIKQGILLLAGEMLHEELEQEVKA